MIVVDVNTIAYLWIPGVLSKWAEAVLARDPDWVSSILWRSEFRNVLTGYRRRGLLDTATIARCLAGAEAQLAGREYVVPAALVLAKTAISTCSAYDCEYIALADDLQTVLVTSDRQLVREFPGLTTSLQHFAAAPP